MNKRVIPAPGAWPRRALAMMLVALSVGAAMAAGNDLPPAVDLRAEAEQSRLAGRPLICLLYTSPSPRD